MPAVRTQVVFDAADPHRLAAFWAEATGYVDEEIDGFVRGLVDAGHAPRELTIEEGGQLRWAEARSLRHPDDGIDERGVGTDRRLLFLKVPEGKTAKNRVHLDLIVGSDARKAEVDRLVGLGATVLYEIDEPSGHHVTLSDPEGNEFCVA